MTAPSVPLKLRSEPVHIPTLPNFLKTDSGATLDVASLSDVGCRELGRLWTQALIRHARNRRKQQGGKP